MFLLILLVCLLYVLYIVSIVFHVILNSLFFDGVTHNIYSESQVLVTKRGFKMQTSHIQHKLSNPLGHKVQYSRQIQSTQICYLTLTSGVANLN